MKLHNFQLRKSRIDNKGTRFILADVSLRHGPPNWDGMFLSDNFLRHGGPSNVIQSC